MTDDKIKFRKLKMIYSEKDVIEKIKNLTKNVKNDQTFESAVDRFITKLW